MTPLLEQMLADGFGCLLLSAAAVPGRNVARLLGVLFDGGRERRRLDPVDTSIPAPSPEVRRTLRTAVTEVVSLPAGYFIAGFGPGVTTVYHQAVPDLAIHAPCVRFEPIAAAVLDLRPRATLEEIAAKAGTVIHETEGSAFADIDALSEMFWVVIEEAGRRGLATRPDELVVLPDARRTAASEAGADPGMLDAVIDSAPAAPGVYILRDASGNVLYVGATTDLRRRLNEHLRPAALPSRKKQTLRKQVRACEFRVTGSGLEALLLESRLIRTLTPAVNVVRELHPRYGSRPEPQAIIAASAREGCAEVFLFRPGGAAVQVRVHLRRPPRRRLLNALRFIEGTSARPPQGQGIVDWGPEGAEICARYLARYRDRLVTLQVDGPPERAAEDLIATLRHLDPAELRAESAEYRGSPLPDF